MVVLSGPDDAHWHSGLARPIDHVLCASRFADVRMECENEVRLALIEHSLIPSRACGATLMRPIGEILFDWHFMPLGNVPADQVRATASAFDHDRWPQHPDLAFDSLVVCPVAVAADEHSHFSVSIERLIKLAICYLFSPSPSCKQVVEFAEPCSRVSLALDWQTIAFGEFASFALGMVMPGLVLFSLHFLDSRFSNRATNSSALDKKAFR
jgi:hypothetical protein